MNSKEMKYKVGVMKKEAAYRKNVQSPRHSTALDRGWEQHHCWMERCELLEALRAALCDLDALKLLGHQLKSYRATRTKGRVAIVNAESK